MLFLGEFSISEVSRASFINNGNLQHTRETHIFVLSGRDDSPPSAHQILIITKKLLLLSYHLSLNVNNLVRFR